VSPSAQLHRVTSELSWPFTCTCHSHSTSVLRSGDFPPALPTDWRISVPCATLSSVESTGFVRWGVADSPSHCSTKCSQSGWRTAAVTYIPRNGTETYPYGLCLCHPGSSGSSSYNPASAQQSPLSECNGPCQTGTPETTCGGVDRAQVVTSLPPVAPPLPVGWVVASFCARDVPSRVLTNVQTTLLANNTPSTCATHCTAGGFAFAGVEDGAECHCGTGYAGGVLPVAKQQWECDVKKCPGDSSLTCGGSWAIQLYSHA